MGGHEGPNACKEGVRQHTWNTATITLHTGSQKSYNEHQLASLLAIQQYTDTSELQQAVSMYSNNAPYR
jgi:hypothetical protein